MGKEVLQMKYHPAKKEVEFHRFQDGQEISIKNDSRLMQYMNLKGKFVLQDHGNTFFEDITSVFNGLKDIEMQVVTTQMDYEDFVQMVEYYNADSNACKITPTLIAELPDMAHTFAEVKKYGEQATEILRRHRQNLFEIPMENENVKKSAESFADQIDKERRNIHDKIESLNDNAVSLCFTGVYSAGKSTLINALLGYKILPEKITSETAKMFRISSPKPGENVGISFEIDGAYAELEWNSVKSSFEFSQGPQRNETKNIIQSEIYRVSQEQCKQHEQICAILTMLNGMMNVSADIRIHFPVALDSSSVQYIIYDTPGTDSNYAEHQTVLMDALSEQKQSILIFVAAPNKTEGSGNNALLKYLKEAEEKNSKTSIDIGRSLFVINWSDCIDSDARRDLQHEEIKYKDDDSFSIRLADKKLFFISAKFGYAARSVRNNIASEKDQSDFNKGLNNMTDKFGGYCYRENRCAMSEFATNRMNERCEEALKDALERKDDISVLEVTSGLYALESEILQYGEKYASAVKASAIIDSVDSALSKLSNRAVSLRESNREEIKEIEKNIIELRRTINETIEREYNVSSIPENMPLPEEVSMTLGLDRASLYSSIVDSTKNYMDRELRGWFLGLLGRVKVRDRDKDNVRDMINRAIDDYTDRFLSQRKILLESQRDIFINAVKQTIMDNGNISKAAKKFFLDVPVPQVVKPGITNWGELYDSHCRTEKFLMFKGEYLDKTGFIQDVEKMLVDIADSMCDDYSRDYRDSLESLLMQIKTQFESNLETYSLYMKAMVESRDAMQQLGDKVADVATELFDCQKQLNDIIWNLRLTSFWL
ncbi:MAG: dynamin family protein [Clostridium sp.]|nr:dynamin family protein [Acetatifactor muris]MCM1526355.1 dynamin family protein [Bacteroides sp.]MCM1563987.1 dynamin family protein [Clostridium sp.]